MCVEQSFILSSCEGGIHAAEVSPGVLWDKGSIQETGKRQKAREEKKKAERKGERKKQGWATATASALRIEHEEKQNKDDKNGIGLKGKIMLNFCSSFIFFILPFFWVIVLGRTRPNRKHDIVQKRSTGPGRRTPEKIKENPIDEAPLLKETGYRYIMLK